MKLFGRNIGKHGNVPVCIYGPPEMLEKRRYGNKDDPRKTDTREDDTHRPDKAVNNDSNQEEEDEL